jgi:hypothetical protein
MKNLLLILIVSFSGICFGQVPPNAFNYSAVARDAQSNPIATQTIGVQISILQTSTLGPVQYQENHFVNTDDFGLFNLIIGAGAIQSGSMNTIAWNADNYYLKVGMDVNGGTNFLTMGTTQLLSVPYALHAATADSIIGGATLNETDPIYVASIASGITATDTTNWNIDNDPVNELQQFQVSTIGDTLYLTNGNSIIIPGISAANAPIPQLSVGDSYGGGIIAYLLQLGDLGYDPNIQHGIIASTSDHGIVEWGCYGTNIIGTNLAIGYGNTNTDLIINNCTDPNIAALICNNLTFSGYSDWYLPSKFELVQLYDNLYLNNQGNFSTGWYWSSSEQDALNAHSVWFGPGGATGGQCKSTCGVSSNYYVRAVRSF